MLVDAIASIILAGMMLIPLINLIVGIIVGASIGGAQGIALGVLLALGITWVQSWWWRRIEWPGEAAVDAASGGANLSGSAVTLDGPITEAPTIRTGPATARRLLGRTGRTEAYRRPEITSGATLRRAR